MFGNDNTPRNRDVSTLNLPGGQPVRQTPKTPSVIISRPPETALSQPKKPKPVAQAPARQPELKQQLKASTTLTPPARLTTAKPKLVIIEEKKPALAQSAGGGRRPPEPPATKAKRQVTVIGGGPTKIQGVDRVPPKFLSTKVSSQRLPANRHAVSPRQVIPDSAIKNTRQANALKKDFILKELSQSGEVIAGRGSQKLLWDHKRICEIHGGKPSDWVKKKSTKQYTLADGTKISMHWLENLKTQKKVEFKYVYSKSKKSS
jgi:hypothetical protein